VSIDVLLIPSVWEHQVTDFLGLQSSTLSMSTEQHVMCAYLWLPHSPQTQPVNSNSCTRQQILLVPVACWISSKTVFALSQNYWFGERFWQQTHVPPCCMPSCTLCCLPGCKLLTFLHPAVPPFTFPLVIPQWCVFQTAACFSVYLILNGLGFLNYPVTHSDLFCHQSHLTNYDRLIQCLPTIRKWLLVPHSLSASMSTDKVCLYVTSPP
jgi:hypothetical protein